MNRVKRNRAARRRAKEVAQGVWADAERDTDLVNAIGEVARIRGPISRLFEGALELARVLVSR